MRRIFLVFVFVLIGCSPAPAGISDPTVTVTSAIPTLTPTHAPSITPLPTATPAPPTRTPLPTIPTFTPTFDVRTIVTVTPAPKAECFIKENPQVVIDLGSCDRITGECSGPPSHEDVLNYLNLGGSLKMFAREAQPRTIAKVMDLTGDGSIDVAYMDYMLGKFFIYSCKDDKYVTLFEFEGTQGHIELDDILDLNKNGLPELILSNHERRSFHSIRIFEWEGNEFRSLIKHKITTLTGEVIAYDWVGGTIFHYKIMDENRDGLNEIIALDQFQYGDMAFYYGSLPLRQETVTLRWNGENLVVKDGQYSSPQYRFQAVQEADQLVLEKDYTRALDRYQQVIFSSDLSWWSKDRKEYENKMTLETWFHDMHKWFIATATPFPTLPAVPLDATEYPRLAAYAYYRMVILHTYLGEVEAAQTKYATLQEKFPVGDPGHPYIEMAMAFWDSYQSTQKMYDACAVVIAYADAHPEILTPLGSDYHGLQSHKYTPADVCPFR